MKPAAEVEIASREIGFHDTRDDTTVTTIRELAAVLVSTFWGRGERGIPGNVEIILLRIFFFVPPFL